MSGRLSDNGERWIPVRDGLDDDWRTLYIADALERDPIEIMGRLCKAWQWASRQTTDGWIPRATARTVDRIVCVDGFAALMVEVGWLEIEGGGLRLPRPEKWNAGAMKRRRQAADRAQRARDARVTGSARKRDASLSLSPSPSSSSSGVGECEGKGGDVVTRSSPDRQNPDDDDVGRIGDQVDPLLVRYEHHQLADRIWTAFPAPMQARRRAVVDAAYVAVADVANRRGIPPPDAADWIVGRLVAYVDSPQGRGSFAGQALGWLRDGRYLDTDAAWSTGSDGEEAAKQVQRERADKIALGEIVL